MRISVQLPTGVAALFGESARRRRRLESQIATRLETADFDEVVLPVVDYLDPYRDMLSEQSRQELYRFVDRDGEVLSLRADFTPMLARLLAPRLARLELPLKLFYRGDVLRYREEHLGERELYQIGAEVLGVAGEDAEALVLRQFLELLQLGAPRPLGVVVGLAGALDPLILEHSHGKPLRLAGALLRRERAVVEAAHPVLAEVVRHGRPTDPDALGEVGARRLKRLIGLVETLDNDFPDIDLYIDLAEFADQATSPELRAAVGPRAYYDGLVFRAHGGDAAWHLGGGGRYDNLFRHLGAENGTVTPVTAAGFSFDVDRLAGGMS
ncbi:MAG: ATP phosphoribosyltransferase regulatory subunit [Acidobacteriota bacterium]